ncbi:ATP-binding protein [Vandammella animalimorsus]|uniref:ATP-binding protein n=1 Tax=Vandammella animalimorsus TaxID=2029117 RepID=A0A3M6R6J1_9BURK|nr:AAA family ATPase [Vandammella animalimorsus]RMX10992.1 ATP-binding protein [Vandammella animalimorsus]
MKLESLSLKHCGGFEQLDTISFEPDVTLIAGVNGVGKSTLLKAIAVILSRAQRRMNIAASQPLSFGKDDIFIGSDDVQIVASMDFNGRKIRADYLQSANVKARKKFDLLGATPEKTTAECLGVYFSPKRQLPGQPRNLPEVKPFAPSIAYDRALHDREVELREFMHWFRTQEKLGTDNEPHRLKVLDALRVVVSNLMPEFSDLHIQEQPRLGFVVDKRGQPFYLHQLSDGERGLLALVFDLTRRLAIANPNSANPIAEGKALVLIDEIELHLHPKWQRDVLQRLCDTFKACQFVVTTHSPLVLGEVEARCIRFLAIQEDGKIGVTTPTEAFGLDANRILQEHMGARIRNQKMDDELKNLFRLIDDEDFNEARKAIKNLEGRLGGNEPELTRASSLIHFLEGAD